MKTPSIFWILSTIREPMELTSGASQTAITILFVPVFVVVYGFVGAVMSTYWTLAFRRLDIDYAPAYAYPVAPQAPAGPQV